MEKVKERTGIYHEHQQDYLCGQHALNNLLQNPFFSPDTLADIARELDVEEISVLAQNSFELENMNDTGYFSIQVLQRALKTFEIELVPYASQDPIAKQARTSPDSIQAYICNLGEHWFTIRRFGRQYFDLNSFYYVPELISDVMLTMFINLMQEKGYSIFIVHGTLHACLADQQLTANPISQIEYNRLTKDLPRLVMDDKMKDLNKRGMTVVTVPQYLYDELQKNPNDVNVRRKFNSYLPNGITVDDLSAFSDKSKRQEKQQQQSQLMSPRVTQTSTGFLNRNEPLSQDTMGRSLIGFTGINDNKNCFSDDHDLANTDRQLLEKYELQLREKYNQRMLEEGITASLLGSTSAKHESNEVPESNPLPAINLEPISTKQSSLPSSVDEHSPKPTTTHFSASTNVHSPPSTVIQSPPAKNDLLLFPKDEYLPHSVTIYSTPPTDTHSLTQKETKPLSPLPLMLPKTTSPSRTATLYLSSSTDKHSAPPIFVLPNYMTGPSIEELRQRRLRLNGNRDRSIISQVFDFND